ncbi:LamB/YcsF family protein [Ureibacillus chungkukjangi]|uniref:5-oxoprolinase subunit PxpA n=1 Tax=Ureibacillus chungkukjangi TaxID=1202712 RepID=UPI0020405308|nr:5-oxoprolinase subunit PxpA [Ureibacillus chungkukjangi]MCM3386903.1 LamB/YcsF family protein [Ureibacillus chungkukjangi]
MRLDINCDMGESFGAYRLGNDYEILDYVTSINVACGFHAGDPMTMRQTVKRAIEKGVKIGAHPGYPDLQGFGRRNMDFTPEEIYNMIIYQVGALRGFVDVEKTELHHVKPHGALYNQSANDLAKAQAVIDAVYDLNPKLKLYCLAGSLIAKLAREKGLAVFEEAFSDRNYNEDGTLVSRYSEQALITNEDEMFEHVKGILLSNEVMTIQKKVIKINAQTLCIHGDGAHAMQFARRISELG